MKRIAAIIFLIAILITACSCSPSINKPDGELSFEDDLGNLICFSDNDKVAACHASFADCWLLSGGELVGITSDAIEDHGLFAEGASIIGTAKSINVEALVASGATVALLSADLVAHLELKPTLEALGISAAYFKVDTFEDYARVMSRFCSVTGRDDLYDKNVTQVKACIDAIREIVPKDSDETFLLMRAYSSGIKAKSDDNLAGIILKELGLKNIVDDHPSMLEDLSLEHIVITDPDYIFVLTMGNEVSALAYLEEKMSSNEAFSSLSAVKNGRYKVLPKELFHYKPNDKWDESYEYIAKILYPDIFN